MQIFKQAATFNFMGKRRLAMVLSLLLIAASIASLATRGLNLGVDFTGGAVIEVGYEQPTELAGVRAALAKDYGDAQVQHFGASTDVLIRLAPREGISSVDLSKKLIDTLQAASEDEVEMRRVEYVGPQVGDELTEQGAFAILYALFGIFVYVFLRFQWQFSVGAVAALFHDVLITLGFFSLLQLEFDLTVLAAILAVIGYSLNDTIVVFDRIRENFRRLRTSNPLDVVNISINETLSRTIITSLTTMLVLLALFFLGGELIHSFATALLVGVVVGTYSSIYVAGSASLSLGVSKADLVQVKPENVNPDGSQV
ncbi:protein translocase subunit SecF [Sulfuriflexus sp.]|uniref:protein translocase subunit SecF n=1 Tax=Sulfuriflexus sp. TaxID=2015443 RepID=UPI0028CE4CFC|nr:protein translocase subunit SecF [Sulfuriflexus sp.]MDT8404048.1 protein translocase subunit SecF [Sulfuriflexus sp.]